MTGRSMTIAMLLIGLAAGVLGGIFGIGGGIVIVPALVLIAGLDQKTATGTSLFALVWPVGLLGVAEYATRNEVRFDWGGLVALGLLGGVLIGAKLTAPMRPATMKRFYGFFLLAVGMYFLMKGVRGGLPSRAGGPEASPLWGLAVGFGAGILGGLFGIGGGLVIVPALALLGGLDQKTAIGSSLFAQVWPVGILGVLEYRRRGEARMVPGVLIALGLLVGNLFGALLTRPLAQRQLELCYGLFCLAIGVYYQFTLIKPAAPTAQPTTDGGETPS